MYLSSGSRPTNYFEPVGRLTVPVTNHISWVSEWAYYGYGESFYSYEGFRSHLVTTGVRIVPEGHMVPLRLILVLSIGAEAATIPSIDSARGEKVFEVQGCSGCHGEGRGGSKPAQNLAATLDRDSTPASLAATMWNHAPGMWAAMHQNLDAWSE